MSNPIACLIVDDEPLAAKVLKEYVEQIPQLSLVGTSTSAMEALSILNEQEVDLLLLDIEMPHVNGIEFVKSLPHPPSVIITTAYREYAYESYEIDVVDYLLKPISFAKFFKAVTKLIAISEAKGVQPEPPATKKSGSIYVYANKKNQKVYFDDILYLESLKDYVTLHTRSGEIVSKSTITKFEELLPESFLRIHRSFIVNGAHITAFTHQDVEVGEKELPIGSSYKLKIMDLLKGEN